ncbi:MAG: DsbA family oxidoreductase [Alphaproteobacteria bacterium]|nr:MAG: DsbA family oxidoreductase [Alphaproteobacteria bacterium]
MRTRDVLLMDVVSDVMCPWCYIGKRRLDRALVLAPDVEPEIRWRPFQLDATIPPEGMDRQEYLNRKFGEQRAREIYKNIKETGEREGIPFAFEKIRKSPNTLNAHRLIRWAETGPQQDEVVERLFELYFTEGEDIGEHSVLVEAAREAGMDADLVAELLKSDRDVDKVKEEIALAHQMGVQGVPTFVIAQQYVLVGAQPAETLADALIQISQEPVFGDENEEAG